MQTQTIRQATEADSSEEIDRKSCVPWIVRRKHSLEHLSHIRVIEALPQVLESHVFGEFLRAPDPAGRESVKTRTSATRRSGEINEERTEKKNANLLLTRTRIFMKIRLDDVVASSLKRIISRQVHGSASVNNIWAKNLATLRSLFVSSLVAKRNTARPLATTLSFSWKMDTHSLGWSVQREPLF